MFEERVDWETNTYSTPTTNTATSSATTSSTSTAGATVGVSTATSMASAVGRPPSHARRRLISMSTSTVSGARRQRRRRVARLSDLLAWRLRRVDGFGGGGMRDFDIDGENDSLGLTYEELLQLDDANVKCGLSNDELADLGCFSASKEHAANDCHICLDAVDFGAEIVALSCRHVFHKHCIHTWLKMKRSCPICRSTF